MKNQLLTEIARMQKLAGIIKENDETPEIVKIYDDAIRYAYDMTPEIMYEDGELESAESIIQAEEEFSDLVRADTINPTSTLAYRRYFENAWGYAQNHGAKDIDDFKTWFTDTAVFSPSYQDNFEQIIK